jgi:hypothetical protein
MLYTYESPLCLPAYKAMNDTQVAAELALPCWRTNLLFEYEAFEVRQRCFVRRFISEYDDFAKTGSGQTYLGGKHSKKSGAFSYRLV